MQGEIHDEMYFSINIPLEAFLRENTKLIKPRDVKRV